MGKCKDVIAPTHPTQPTPPQHEAIRKRKTRQWSQWSKMSRNARPLTGAATKNKPKWQSQSTFAQLRVSSITANWTRQWRNGTYDTTGSYIVTPTLKDFSMLNEGMKQMIATIIYWLKIHKSFLDTSLELPWFMHSKQLNTSCMTKTLWDTESCRSNQEDQAKLRAMAISRIWDLL